MNTFLSVHDTVLHSLVVVPSSGKLLCAKIRQAGCPNLRIHRIQIGRRLKEVTHTLFTSFTSSPLLHPACLLDCCSQGRLPFLHLLMLRCRGTTCSIAKASCFPNIETSTSAQQDMAQGQNPSKNVELSTRTVSVEMSARAHGLICKNSVQQGSETCLRHEN